MTFLIPNHKPVPSVVPPMYFLTCDNDTRFQLQHTKNGWYSFFPPGRQNSTYTDYHDGDIYQSGQNKLQTQRDLMHTPLPLAILFYRWKPGCWHCCLYRSVMHRWINLYRSAHAFCLHQSERGYSYLCNHSHLNRYHSWYAPTLQHLPDYPVNPPYVCSDYWLPSGRIYNLNP